METIKISVEVSVNLSENTQEFVKSLFNSCAAQAATKIAPDQTKKSITSTAPRAEIQSDVKAAPSAPAAQDVSSASKSIEDVRKILSEKVADHREVIKQKLNELGAPSVTKLDPSKYDEMYNFLTSL